MFAVVLRLLLDLLIIATGILIFMKIFKKATKKDQVLESIEESQMIIDSKIEAAEEIKDVDDKLWDEANKKIKKLKRRAKE